MSTSLKIKSPLTNLEHVVLEKTIEVKDIIKAYKDWGIDTSIFFKELDSIFIYRCIDTGYRFYYPFTLAGNGRFYEQLQKFDWYYMDWKWEHENALRYLNKNDSVLEIGCAKGTFINKLKEMDINCLGLELNQNAVDIAKKKSLPIYNETIQEHSKLNPDKYDLVCSFQVMEHIAEIKEVLQCSVNVLKKGGKLIISVPNNDSFLRLDTNYLNMPPHHMGLWNKESLSNLNKVLHLKIKSIDFEPLQAYHYEYFFNTLKNVYTNEGRMGLIKMHLIKAFSPMSRLLYSKIFKAFTIQAIYEKC